MAEEREKIEELTVKFGKGCIGNTFTGKDGKEYTSILIPNSDPDDHRPWATFVARANAVHEDKFGKGMWVKLPADGTTTIRRDNIAGQDEAGKVGNYAYITKKNFYKKKIFWYFI